MPVHSPLTSLAQIEPPLLLGAVAQQQLDPGLGQDRAQAERQVGAVPHLPDRDRDRRRQTLAAPGLRKLQPVPAARDELAGTPP